MSCTNKTTDNKYFNCPPRMDDGRHFTDYRSNCHFNNLVRANNAIINSHDYRMFLSSNARKLMDLNRSYASQKNGCGPRPNSNRSSTIVPEESVQICNNLSCNVDFVNKNGIGRGRQYNSNGQSCESLESAMPVNQPYNCSADGASLFNYYNHMNSKAQGELVIRNSSVSNNTVPDAYNL